MSLTLFASYIFLSLCPSHFLLSFITTETTKEMCISAIFFFSSLSFYFYSVLLFPPLGAEEPQCLLLTFSYHLSLSHHSHYLPLFSVIFSRLPGSPLLSVLLICLLLSHQYSPTLADSRLSSASPTRLRNSLSLYIIIPPDHRYRTVLVTPASVVITSCHSLAGLSVCLRMCLSYYGKMWF